MIYRAQAFSPSYDLALPYPFLPLSVSSTGDTQETEKERQIVQIVVDVRKRGTKSPNHTTARKPGPL
jgi:hypothetical protein